MIEDQRSKVTKPLQDNMLVLREVPVGAQGRRRARGRIRSRGERRDLCLSRFPVSLVRCTRSGILYKSVGLGIPMVKAACTHNSPPFRL